jgi:hypothetical protein
VLVINLAGEKETYAGLIGEAMHVFDDQVIVISVPDDGNHVLYAFKEHHFEPRWRWLHNYAKELRAKFGLDFPLSCRRWNAPANSGWPPRGNTAAISCYSAARKLRQPTSAVNRKKQPKLKFSWPLFPPHR